MLILRYEPVDLFKLVHTLPELADSSDLAMDPLLSALDQALDDDRLVLLAWNDWVTRRPHCLETGRRSTPVEASIRLQAVRRLYGWAYRQVHLQVKGNLALRQFTRVYGHRVPNHATMNDWELALRRSTVRLINQRVVQLAIQHEVTQGKKLRSDSTVTETNIHYPTDSSLLDDSVRVVGRMLRAARRLVGDAPGVSKDLFVNRTRSTHRLAREIARASRKGKGASITPKTQKLYRKMLKTTRESLDHARQVIPILQRHGPRAAQTLAESLAAWLPLVERVMDQTQRRVLLRQSVSASEKLVSLFEPHTDIICRGKPAPRDTEFGHKIWLDEVDGGIISDYRILMGNPPDAESFKDSLPQHRKLFHHPPEHVAVDRGAYSPHNERATQQAGVAYVSMPQPGHRTPERVEYERQQWFRLDQRFRAGSEGRISVLKRARQLDRCLDKGAEGFEKWVGWGCIVNNLVLIAQAILKKPRRRRSVASAG